MLANPGYQLNGIPVIKIGYTTHSMAASLRQIYSTGVPFPFEVKYQAMVWKARATMRHAHGILHAQRLNNERDFFNCTIQEAIDAVELSVQGDITYKAERPPELYSADTAFNPDALKEPDIVEEEAAGKAWSKNKRTDTPGYVYVLTNEVYHDGHAPLLKIGYTRKEPKERAEDLYYWEYECWGVPQNFKVAFAARFEHAFDTEQRVHEFLKEFRVNHWREFFSCTLEEAKLAIQAEQDREVSQNAPAKITLDPSIILAEKQEPTSRPVPVPVPVPVPAPAPAPVPVPVPAPIIVSPQRPERPQLVLQPAKIHHVLPSRWRPTQRQAIAGLILLGCVVVAVPGYHFLSNWVSSLQTPTAKQAPDPAPHPKPKKAHGHPKKKKKKHKKVKNQQPSEGTADQSPQYEAPLPADSAPSNQAGDPNPG
ncbi:GIY-YIG nuclease family protein [Aquitalea magnusonii]|uniref:GIY-YIG nuclease family protein n=1 Tax=Aquitalea aquatica TaxID=3044273 RepID=A0A838Y1M4_9NEIS|nr:GIY-YIG nuclease family protein [Aquitalea magnusonii]